MARRAGVAFGLALTSLVLIGGGVAVDVWMANLPAIDTSCGVGCIQGHTSPLDQRWVGVLFVMLGSVLLVIAWQADKRPGGRPRQGWKSLWSWGAPLLWLVFIPVIAGPVTYVLVGGAAHDRSCQISVGPFGGGGSDCPAGVYLPSVVLPGLLNFVPLFWLLSRLRRRRVAAAVATLIGIAGFATSILVLRSLGPTVRWDFGFLFPNLPPTQQAGLPFWVVLWLAAIIALLVIAKLRLPPERTSAASV